MSENNENLFVKLCDYCGKVEGTEEIPDPNMTGDSWCVCKECKICIHEQQGLALLHILKQSAEKHNLNNLVNSYDDKIKQKEQSITNLGGTIIVIRRKKGDKNTKS